MKDGGNNHKVLLKELNDMRKKNKDLEKKIESYRQNEIKLHENEERLKVLFEYAPDAYYLNDMKGKFIDGNKAAEN